MKKVLFLLLVTMALAFGSATVSAVVQTGHLAAGCPHAHVLVADVGDNKPMQVARTLGTDFRGIESSVYKKLIKTFPVIAFVTGPSPSAIAAVPFEVGWRSYSSAT